MKSAPVGRAALVFLTLAAGTVQAEGGITGSVRRLDERTYRIQLGATYELEIWPNCPDSEICQVCSCDFCHDWNYFNLSGPFGLPTNLDPDANCADCDRIEEDYVGCYGPCTGMAMQFDFEPSITGTSRLTLEWHMWGDYRCSACTYDDTICGTGGDGGAVYSVLPSRIGDSAPLEPVLAVEPTTWGMVKRLYR